MKNLHIHPLTYAVFFIIMFTSLRKLYFTLYIFVFFHELSHFLMARVMGARDMHIHLLPWGCVLSLDFATSKLKNALILFSGPLFNFIMFIMGIFPRENLSLCLFNLFPVIPLDGGIILNILFPSAYVYISGIFILVLFILCLNMGIIPLLPLLLLVLLISGEKAKMKTEIDIMVLRHFKQK